MIINFASYRLHSNKCNLHILYFYTFQILDRGSAAQLVKTVLSCLLLHNMETRIQSVEVTKVSHCGHTFKNIREFPPGVLPTNKEVIC